MRKPAVVVVGFRDIFCRDYCLVLIPIRVPEPEAEAPAEAEDAISPANSLKRRLLGAAVLLALGVIVLPLLLDGSGSESRFRRVETVREYPPKIIGADGQPELQLPKPVAKEPAVAAAQAPAKTQEPIIREPVADTAPEPAAKDNALLARLEQVIAKPELKPEPQAPVRTLRRNSPTAEIDAALERLGERTPASQSDNVIASNDVIAATAGDRTLSGVAVESAAWVVQAGSFVDEENALRLRDALRYRGFPSFVATVGDREISQTLRYRVQVGPLADRQNAELRQREIERITGGSALVREYR